MNFAALSTRLQTKVPGLVSGLANGACKFLYLDTTNAADEQGFLRKDFVARTADFLPCIWIVDTEEDAREQEIGAKATGVVRYKIVISKSVDDVPVAIEPSDQVQLKLSVEADSYILLEVQEVIDQSGINWEVWSVTS